MNRNYSTEYIIYKVNEVGLCKDYGMEMNSKKTKTMVSYSVKRETYNAAW